MKNTSIGLFLVTLSAVMQAMLLAKVLDAATWPHISFLTISLALFGAPFGCALVFLMKGRFEKAAAEKLALFSVLSGVTSVLAILIFLSAPFDPGPSVMGVFAAAYACLVLSMPFWCAGVVISLSLMRFAERTGFFYALVFTGCAMGALMAYPVLRAMDAPSGIMLSAALGALGGFFFSRIEQRRMAGIAPVAFVLLTVLMAINLVYRPVALEWAKGARDIPQEESWGMASRVSVSNLHIVRKPYGTGLSRAYEGKALIGERIIDADGVYRTVMVLNDAPGSGDHLKYDVAFIARRLKENAEVFVIGMGGGREALAGKAFGDRNITVAEPDTGVYEMVNVSFGEFTGHLDKSPGVSVINEDARAVLERTDKEFDVIQQAFTLPWQAVEAGGIVLSEDGLHTIEAWKLFLRHLKPDGVISFTGWYSKEYPAQIMKLASLAAAALSNEGVKDASGHIAVVRSESQAGGKPLATILVGKAPFSEEAMARLKATVDGLKFQFEYLPGGYQNPNIKTAVERAGETAAPTDDRPYFHIKAGLAEFFSSPEYAEQKYVRSAVGVLLLLLAAGAALFSAVLSGPMLLSKRDAFKAKGSAASIVFFSAAGFGLMLVLMVMLKRLSIFLGSPVYGVAVVIFPSLIASGAGAAAGGFLSKKGGLGYCAASVSALMLSLLAIACVQPSILAAFASDGIYAKASAALLFVLPTGFLAGVPLPKAMSAALASGTGSAAWLLALTVGSCIVAAALGTCAAISFGFTAVLLLGAICYLIALIALASAMRRA